MTTEFSWNSRKWQKKFDQYSDQIIRWPLNFDQNYLQEIDDKRILILDFKDFDQNSGSKLCIVTINIRDFGQNYLQEIDDNEIPILDFKDFDQNSGS